MSEMNSFDQLLRHEHFVRQTLQGLLRDPAAVDDAVQETWLRAWRRAPDAVAGKTIVESKAAKDTLQGEWTGLLEILRGEERRTFVEVGNGSHADVVITGRFEHR